VLQNGASAGSSVPHLVHCMAGRFRRFLGQSRGERSDAIFHEKNHPL